jgi:hypothetical protein
MRSENKFLRILSLGPLTGSKPFAEAIWRYYPGLLAIRKLASQKSASGKLRSLVQIVGNPYGGQTHNGAANTLFVLRVIRPQHLNCNREDLGKRWPT